MSSGTVPWRVVWTRGDGCRELAAVLADGHAVKANQDLRSSCIEARATMLVARDLPSFDFCSVAVPHDFDSDAVRSVVAAVGGGPHSGLAAVTAQRIAVRLGVPARLVTGYRRPDQREQADAVLADLSRSVTLPSQAVLTTSPPAMAASEPPGTLLVIGAPGGSWFQRQLIGPGARLQAKAPGGVVVVRMSSMRVFQVMQPPRAIGSHMRVRDAVDLTTDWTVAVADHGRLVGLVTRSTLLSVPEHLQVGTVADTPVSVTADELVDDVLLLLAEHGGGPIPVVDERGLLHGVVASSDIDGGLSEAS